MYDYNFSVVERQMAIKLKKKRNRKNRRSNKGKHKNTIPSTDQRDSFMMFKFHHPEFIIISKIICLTNLSIFLNNENNNSKIPDHVTCNNPKKKAKKKW